MKHSLLVTTTLISASLLSLALDAPARASTGDFCRVRSVRIKSAAGGRTFTVSSDRISDLLRAKGYVLSANLEPNVMISKHRALTGWNPKMTDFDKTVTYLDTQMSSGLMIELDEEVWGYDETELNADTYARVGAFDAQTCQERLVPYLTNLRTQCNAAKGNCAPESMPGGNYASLTCLEKTWDAMHSESSSRHPHLVAEKGIAALPPCDAGLEAEYYRDIIGLKKSAVWMANLPSTPAYEADALVSNARQKFVRVTGRPELGRDAWMDESTGLIWGSTVNMMNWKAAEPFREASSGGYQMTPANAEKYCASIGARLPTREEAQTLTTGLGIYMERTQPSQSFLAGTEICITSSKTSQEMHFPGNSWAEDNMRRSFPDRHLPVVYSGAKGVYELGESETYRQSFDVRCVSR